jgi:hypothetical protein
MGYSADTWSAIANVIYGKENAGSNSGKMGRFNLIADWNPTESFSGWMDFTYAWDTGSAPVTSSGNADVWGIAVAGRYGFTDRLGAALRAEYVADNNNFIGVVNSLGTASTLDDFPVDMSIWSLTGTVDYELAENLTTKFELRWDHANYSSGSVNEFANSRSNVSGELGDAFTKANQFVGGIEVVYPF